MRNTIMDRFAEKQTRISQRRTGAASRYPETWTKLIADWNSPGAEDRVWLTYSANYLFRTNNVRWAMDPLTLTWRIKDAPKVDVVQDLSRLSFVLLTHRHKDHLDMDLISMLRYLPIVWVVPEFLLQAVIREAGLPRKNIVTAIPLEPVSLNGVRILPFHGLHWETIPGETRKGVPALGYLIEANGKRWLLPGDTRTYDARQLPNFGPVDQLFAHLWLGRGCALMDDPPLTSAFCQFCFDLQPRQIILTHLNEFGRNADDLWDESHIRKIRPRFQTITANVPIVPVQMGESILL